MRDALRQRMNDYLAHIPAAEFSPSDRTEELYVPNRKTIADMDAGWLKRNLCHAAQGNVNNCRECPAPCMIGKALQRSVVSG